METQCGGPGLFSKADEPATGSIPTGSSFDSKIQHTQNFADDFESFAQLEGFCDVGPRAGNDQRFVVLGRIASTKFGDER